MDVRFLGLVVALVLVGWMEAAPAATAQRFYPDDPIWEDPDRMDMPAPEAHGVPDGPDPIGILASVFGQAGNHTGPAVNVNTVEGVPNSSWYTNRHYHDRLSLDALARGPNTRRPPDTSAAWTVLRVDEANGLPHAVVRDGADRTYRLWVDHRRHPELATGAAMIGSRLLHALGYNVPEHWLMRIRPNRLTAAADTVVQTGTVRKQIFGEARADSTGRFRVLLTRLPGAVRRIGPFAFHGTRPDDANDIFPHEARRELRGLRVAAAWINHSKIHPSRTMDVLVTEDDRKFVRHYLTRLTTVLGSGGARPKRKWSGHEHILEIRAVLTRMGTLGLSGGGWMEATAPDLRGVGHIESEQFRPGAWRPEAPNPAFERCDSTDAFWAARQIAAFTAAEIRAVVETAEYSNPQTTDYLVRTLRERQRAIARAYLGYGGGIDRFAVQGDSLRFVDLLARHDLAPAATSRTVTWHVFDNEADRVRRRLRRVRSPREALRLPSASPPFLRAVIETPGQGTTAVYLRRQNEGRYAVVGRELEPQRRPPLIQARE